MTLKEAVSVLSERRHRGRPDWLIKRNFHSGLWLTVGGPDYREYILDPFEALAVAERYLSGQTPEKDDAAAQAEMAGDL